MYLTDLAYVLLFPCLLLAMYAQWKVHSAYRKYSHWESNRGEAGAQVARALLDEKGIGDVQVIMGKGELTDHYDPIRRLVVLSPGVYNGRSLAALAIAAHETGHAYQHQTHYVPLTIRSFLSPGVGFANTMAIPVFLLGLFFSTTLTTIGLYLFAGVLLFQIVTLPVEFNASSRAMAALRNGGYLDDEEYPAAQKVLSAAAMTYVAAALVTLLQFMRLLGMSGRRRR